MVPVVVVLRREVIVPGIQIACCVIVIIGIEIILVIRPRNFGV
jgi:hypothetical protein